jgi:hypothetical protein
LDAIPRELRSNVMLAVETGRLLYRAMPDGSLVQDTALDKELEGLARSSSPASIAVTCVACVACARSPRLPQNADRARSSPAPCSV